MAASWLKGAPQARREGPQSTHRLFSSPNLPHNSMNRGGGAGSRAPLLGDNAYVAPSVHRAGAPPA